jgi:hypothetical protein
MNKKKFFVETALFVIVAGIVFASAGYLVTISKRAVEKPVVGDVSLSPTATSTQEQIDIVQYDQSNWLTYRDSSGIQFQYPPEYTVSALPLTNEEIERLSLHLVNDEYSQKLLNMQKRITIEGLGINVTFFPPHPDGFCPKYSYEIPERVVLGNMVGLKSDKNLGARSEWISISMKDLFSAEIWTYGVWDGDTPLDLWSLQDAVLGTFMYNTSSTGVDEEVSLVTDTIVDCISLYNFY